MRMIAYCCCVLAHLPPVPGTAAPSAAELFRVLGDDDRLRLLALCAADELTVGELAELTRDSQSQVSRKCQPLRAAGLLHARREGTRTLLSAASVAAGSLDAPVVEAALREGRRLCVADGSLSRVPLVVAAREDVSRRFFEGAAAAEAGPVSEADLPHAFAGVIAPLLPGRALAVDVGAGEGAFLPLLSPLYERVFALDRSRARLARCAARVARLGLPNVRQLEGSVDDPAVMDEVQRRGGADLVLVARVLHHAARPAEMLAACARLLRRGGHLVVLDYAPHDDESMRAAQADVWLGFAPAQLETWLAAAGLVGVHVRPFDGPLPAGEPDAHVPWVLAAGLRPPGTVALS
jgi:ArsR family transcriptional regulator